MTIVNNIVIIKGEARESADRASGKALDCDTLLVLEDRKVFGFVSTPHRFSNEFLIL